jgi:hypothetical protein
MMAFATAAGAQTTTVLPVYEVGVGYQALRAGEICDDGVIVETCVPDRWFPFGLNVDVVRNFGSIGLGVVGEVGFSRDSEDDVSFGMWNFAGGIRWTGRVNPKFSPYGQFLIGGVRSSISADTPDFDASSTDFMLQPGAGVNFGLNDRFNAFAQFDLRRVALGEVGVDDDLIELPITADDVTRNDFRFVLGIRFAVGSF